MPVVVASTAPETASVRRAHGSRGPSGGDAGAGRGRKLPPGGVRPGTPLLLPPPPKFGKAILCCPARSLSLLRPGVGEVAGPRDGAAHPRVVRIVAGQDAGLREGAGQGVPSAAREAPRRRGR